MKNVLGTSKISTPSDREIAITRDFDAPRRLVFEAHTKPDLIRRWLGGHPGWTMPVCEYDPRVGGRYRFVWRRDEDGSEMGMGGVIREIEPPARIVQAEKFDEAWYPGEAVVTTTFDEHDGRTTLTLTILYESKEARDMAIKTDMAKGVDASYERLDEVLASQAR